MQEEWRDVVGYEGIYQVSNLGRVKRTQTNTNTYNGKVLTPIQFSIGYLAVNLCRNGKPHLNYIHRLVAQAFIPNPKNKPHIDHIDGTRTNNCVENLRWATRQENQNNPITKQRIGVAKRLNPSRSMLGKTGAMCPTSKPVVCVETGKVFGGIAEAKRKLGIRTICAVLKNRQQTAGGYHWRYATESEINAVKS